MSLARLWRRQGKTDQGRQVVAEVHGRFTEDFDTADLEQATALLAGLPGASGAATSSRRRLRR